MNYVGTPGFCYYGVCQACGAMAVFHGEHAHGVEAAVVKDAAFAGPEADIKGVITCPITACEGSITLNRQCMVVCELQQGKGGE